MTRVEIKILRQSTHVGSFCPLDIMCYNHYSTGWGFYIYIKLGILSFCTAP